MYSSFKILTTAVLALTPFVHAAPVDSDAISVRSPAPMRPEYMASYPDYEQSYARSLEPQPMEDDLLGLKYQMCYVKYVPAKREVIEKRCGEKVKREPEPEPMDVSKTFQMCYISYESARSLSDEELIKRCSK